MVSSRRNGLTELISGLLDKRYDRVAMPVIRAIASTSTSGIIAQRLEELEQEAQRLDTDNKRLKRDNPVLVAFLADFETQLNRNAARIDGIANDLTNASADAAATITRQTSLGGATDAQLASLGITWNKPDPEAVAALVNLADSPAFEDELRRYTQTSMQVIQNQVIIGLTNGYGPIRTARMIRQAAEGYPAHAANTLARTLQIQSYRTATAANYAANEDILKTTIRIAALDERCCLACIALHGQPLDSIYDRVLDHHNGRCTSIAVVKGRPAPNIQTGPDWFESLPREQKLKIAGPGALDLLDNGATLEDFVHPYNDPLFRDMLRQASLKSVIAKTGIQPTPKTQQKQQRQRQQRQTAQTRPLTPLEQHRRDLGEILASNPPPPLNSDVLFEPSIQPGIKTPQRLTQYTIPQDLHDDAQRWHDSLNYEERDAIRYYTGKGYSDIRQYYEDGKPGFPDDGEPLTNYVVNLEKAMARAPRFNATVWRGLKYYDNQGVDWSQQVGTTIQWDAISSTSINPAVAVDFSNEAGVVFQIRTNRAFYIAPGSEYKPELEALFQPGSRLRVTGTTTQEIQDRYGAVEVRTIVYVDDVTDEDYIP